MAQLDQSSIVQRGQCQDDGITKKGRKKSNASYQGEAYYHHDTSCNSSIVCVLFYNYVLTVQAPHEETHDKQSRVEEIATTATEVQLALA